MLHFVDISYWIIYNCTNYTALQALSRVFRSANMLGVTQEIVDLWKCEITCRGQTKVNLRILFLLSELNLLYEVCAHCCLYRAMFIVFTVFSGNLWVHGRLLTRGIYTIYTVNTHILHLPIYKHIFIYVLNVKLITCIYTL